MRDEATDNDSAAIYASMSSNGVLTIELRGDWVSPDSSSGDEGVKRIELSGSNIITWDSKIMVAIFTAWALAERHGMRLGVTGLPDGIQELLRLSLAVPWHALIDYRDQISFINVSDAEGSDTGNGHGYFRSSPWASSDVLMMMYYGLTPQQRGLVEQDDLPIYTFPPDYISRLWNAIETVDPEFAEDYRALNLAQ